jgi:hypothetical protein
MKKITIFAFAALALTFASCKKDRTCTCTNTYTPTSGSASDSTYEVTVKKATKSQVKNGICASYADQQTAPIAGGKDEFKCELK